MRATSNAARKSGLAFSSEIMEIHADILALGLRLDFETAIEIIQSAFTVGYAASSRDDLAEAEDYSQSNTGNYSVIDEQILQPLDANQRIIRTITQMISAHYGAHG